MAKNTDTMVSAINVAMGVLKDTGMDLLKTLPVAAALWGGLTYMAPMAVRHRTVAQDIAKQLGLPPTMLIAQCLPLMQAWSEAAPLFLHDALLPHISAVLVRLEAATQLHAAVAGVQSSAGASGTAPRVQLVQAIQALQELRAASRVLWRDLLDSWEALDPEAGAAYGWSRDPSLLPLMGSSRMPLHEGVASAQQTSMQWLDALAQGARATHVAWRMNTSVSRGAALSAVHGRIKGGGAACSTATPLGPRSAAIVRGWVEAGGPPEGVREEAARRLYRQYTAREGFWQRTSRQRSIGPLRKNELAGAWKHLLAPSLDRLAEVQASSATLQARRG